MDLNLRNAVIANVTGNNQDQLEHTIVDAIQSGEEKMLPASASYSKFFGSMRQTQKKMKCSKHLKAD